MPTVFYKEKYVFHNENLRQLYLRLGLKLKKIHRVSEFNQSQWLKLCIEFNTHKMETKMEKRCTNWWIKMHIKTKLYVAPYIWQ